MNRESDNPSGFGPGIGPRLGDRVDLQIVGGGVAGLIAANLAVDAGLSVRLLGKQRSVGGRAASAAHHGFTLNQGPHALYLNGALHATLQALGIDPVGRPPKLKGALGSIGSTIGLLPQGPGSLLRTPLLPARGKRQLVRLMARLPKIDAAPLASVTVDDWIDQLTDVPELRSMLFGLVNLATYNSASSIASADAAVTQLQMVMGDGVIYLAGGWTSIVDALLARLEGPDAAVPAGRFERVTTAVAAVRPEPGADREWCMTAGGHFPASNVLIATGLPTVADRLLADTGSPLADRAGPPVRVAVLDLGLARPPRNDIFLALDRRLYLSTHSIADGLAPSGQGLVSVARYVRPDDQLGADETKAMLVDHARAGGIDLDDVVMDRYLHRLTVTGGMPLAAQGGLAGRPGVTVAGRPGLYLAGDWVGGRGLLADAGAASATEAVDAVLDQTSPAGRGRPTVPTATDTLGTDAGGATDSAGASGATDSAAVGTLGATGR